MWMFTWGTPVLALILLCWGPTRTMALREEDRLVGWNERNYTWPMEDRFTPNTEGWRKLMSDRLRQVAEIGNSGDRYEGYLQTMSSAVVAPNFTEHGFGLARCPQELLEALQAGIRDGFDTKTTEHSVEVIDGADPWFIHRPDLNRRVIHELQHYAEAWVENTELLPSMAYGFRLYRNESVLYMHVDKMNTHVISFILHIDSSEDAEPWPIFIEDLHGRTHEVILTPGDILFYESSKCWHGRPKRFKGTWYSSLFVHYRPKHGWHGVDHKMEAHYAVPPQWRTRAPPKKKEPKLKMFGTSMSEPDCPNAWCRSVDSIKWSGPGEEGFVIDPDFTKRPFNPVLVAYNAEL